ncbi:MAG: hypothetical protein ACJ777_01130 [Chloroflexota bacterium]
MHDETAQPIEDARGPHLPDVVTRNWAAAFFVLLGIAYVIWYATHLSFAPDASLADFVVAVLQPVPAVTAILLPAAILLRHPDAWQTVRTILFGAILYAAVQGMLILADPLEGFFETLTPASEDLPFLVPASAVYNGLISIVAAFGLGYIAVGLSISRRYTDTRSRWVTGWFVPVATVVATVLGVLSVARIDFVGTPLTPPLAVYLASSVILGVVRIVVWAFLSSVVTRGWLEGEEPRAGWALASIATWLVLLTLLTVNLTGVIDVPVDTVGTLLRYLIVSAYAAGHLLLLFAFLVGLPMIEAVGTADDADGPDEEDDEEDEDDEDVFGDDDFEDEDGEDDDFEDEEDENEGEAPLAR